MLALTAPVPVGTMIAFDCGRDENGGRLTDRCRRRILFNTLDQDAGYDTAVSDESIRGVADNWSPAPAKRNVICHHLNYSCPRSD